MSTQDQNPTIEDTNQQQNDFGNGNGSQQNEVKNGEFNSPGTENNTSNQGSQNDDRSNGTNAEQAGTGGISNDANNELDDDSTEQEDYENEDSLEPSIGGNQRQSQTQDDEDRLVEDQDDQWAFEESDENDEEG